MLENDAFVEGRELMGDQRPIPGMRYHRDWRLGNHDQQRSDDQGRKHANVEASMGSQSDRSSDMMHAGAIAMPILRLLICIVAVVVVTAALNTVALHDRPVSTVLIFLFLVLIVSHLWGLRYAVFVSLLAALGFSWLIPPAGHFFWRSTSGDILVLVVFLVVGITTSHVSDRARREALNAKRAEAAARRSEEGLREIIETIPAMAWSALPDGSNAFVNRRWAEYTGLSAEQTAGSGWRSTVHPEDVSGHLEKWRRSLATGQPFEREVRLRRTADGQYRWFLARGMPLRDEHGNVLKWYGILTDIEDRKRAETFLAGEKRILEMVAKGDSLLQILDSVCRFVEEQASGVLASILLVDDNRLWHGGAPSLPKAYTDAINGAVIGPSAGSCGTAAYRGDQVIVEDIATDPLWADYREAALPHSLRACWSTPVFSSQGRVMATFAMYYGEPRSPSPRDQQIIEQITHLAGVAIERKLTQEAVRRSEAYLAEAQRLTRTGSWALNVRTGVRFWSQETFRIFDYDPEKVTPTWDVLLERVHPEDRPEVERRREMESTQKEWTDSGIDFRIVLPDGTIKHLHSIAHPAMDESGEITEVVGTIMDVTERKRAEEALRRSEGYLAEAERLTKTGSWAWDIATSHSVYWSQENYRIFGFDPERGIPSHEAFYQRIHPEDRDRVHRDVFLERMAEGSRFDGEFRIVLPEGGIVKYIRSIGHPVCNTSGDVLAYVGTSMDVTERKRADEERERLRQLEADLAHMNRVTMLGELASSLAHELNQPITAATTSANACLLWLARNPPDLVRARAAIMRIEKNGSRAAEIIQRLRTFYTCNCNKY